MPRCLISSMVLLVGFCAVARAQSPSTFQTARKKLVREAIVGAGVTHRGVIESMLKTPRHEFVPSNQRRRAYFDMALPIGDRQTISSPFIVSYMTQSLDPRPTDKVLEIGTGSGYQAAVLSSLVRDVYTIEIVPSLGRRAKRVLERLHYENVHTKVGDGFLGWPEHAPFDKIIVTCSPEQVPRPLIEQLREGGRMVIPVGRRYQQTLVLLRKKDGKLQSEALRPTLFVPMTGEAEDQRRIKPDPKRPALVNGGFEQTPKTGQFQPGWYYQRQVDWISDPKAPEGTHFITFANEEPGRISHLLQGFAIDGRSVQKLQIQCRVATENVQTGRSRDESALVAVTFYDEERRQLGLHWLGPFRGSNEWHPQDAEFTVPIRTREAILRVGLFGATGQLSIDDVRIIPTAR